MTKKYMGNHMRKAVLFGCIPHSQEEEHHVSWTGPYKIVKQMSEAT